MGARKGNQNAKVDGKHPGMVIRLKTPTVDILCDFFALEGNTEPTREDIQNAVDYAVRQVYGRQVEEKDGVIIL
jgi:hypothetical protein